MSLGRNVHANMRMPLTPILTEGEVYGNRGGPAGPQQKLTESQMREIGDRARKIFKDEMGLTYTKENNKILQDIHQRLEKEELDKIQAEYLQKRKQVVGGIKRRKTRASKKSKKRNTRRTRK